MSDKVILITGASSGIGKTTAIKVAKEGYKVILTARREELLEEIVNEVGRENAFAVTSDITQLSELGKVIHQGVDKFGHLDAVFANAGKGLDKAGVENGSPEEWDKMIDLNIKSVLYTAKMTLPLLRQTKGHFILTSSVAGKIRMQGSVYSASKWFTSGFGYNLAKEMKEWGGRCTTICPGMVNTEFFDEPKPDKLQPEDIADAVLYALSAPTRCTVTEMEIMPTN